jgi:hypothetical protein
MSTSQPVRPHLVPPDNATRAIPATVAAEVTGDCEGPGRASVRHRVWVHRDGTISAPDHDADSAAEQVARALGDEQTHFCQFWVRLNKSAERPTRSLSGIPHRTLPSWRMTYESFWTPQGAWAALTGILNSITFSPINPASALAYAQAYIAVAGRMPDQAFEHLAILATPWVRQHGGYRRRHAVSAEELRALLNAGVPVDNAAVFAALDLTSEQARSGIQALRAWGHPPDLLIRLCYALPPAPAIEVLRGLGPERGKRLPSLLTDLAAFLEKTPDLTEENVANFLLGR